jgi:hypothetical protein
VRVAFTSVNQVKAITDTSMIGSAFIYNEMQELPFGI